MRPRGREMRLRAVQVATILAIAGTLSACGVYGRPVRTTSAQEPTQETIEAPAQPAEDPTGEDEAEDRASKSR
jgi:hypothetical protein